MYPKIEASGVRSSWLTRPMNSSWVRSSSYRAVTSVATNR